LPALANNGSDNRCVFEAVVREGREQHIEDWTLNGKTFDVVGRPMFKESGQLSHVVMSYSDVSARRNAEAALLEALHETQSANAKLHGILRSVADGVLVSDQDGKILLMNRRAEELFGLKLSDSQSPLFVSQLSNQKLTGLLVGAIAQGEEQQIHDVVFDQAGEREQVYQARITAIDAQQADFKGCITIFHDVTEERKIDHMKSEFVSTAAHELRTPLATIIGYTDLLLLKEDTDLSEQKEYLELIQDRAERLGDIVSDLLDISRIESGEALNVELKPCQIKLFCQEVVDSYRRQLPKHSFTLSVGAQDMVIADRFAVIQILENVISNAIKYSPDGGVISLVGVKDENMYHLAIADQGMGMNEAQVARIFEKFYRADATNTAISGTGLGMTIVKYLIESLNGKIQLESVADKGTTVTLSFPLFSA
ncbi:MAG: cell wall metabolism sensor histidine kinase WalK, partial [Desulfuromonadales bacterium]|nr:cell wall metabolism sensor histidine kinase WalK [Desulfuromonadales bacterium]